MNTLFKTIDPLSNQTTNVFKIRRFDLKLKQKIILLKIFYFPPPELKMPACHVATLPSGTEAQFVTAVQLKYLASYLLPARKPPVGHGPLMHDVSSIHTTTRHTRYDSSGRGISSSRPVPNNTQHSQETNIHAPGGIRTHNLSKRAAAELRLGLGDHWDRHLAL